MKKFILLISALLLITTLAFSQRNYNAGKLSVNKEAVFNGTLTTNASIKTMTVSASDFMPTIINASVSKDYLTLIYAPQLVTLHGGSCDGSQVMIKQVSVNGTTLWFQTYEDTPCTDYTSVSFSYASKGDVSIGNNTGIMGHLSLSNKYKLINELDCEGPVNGYGTMFEVVSGNVLSRVMYATHLYYPEVSGFPSQFYFIDSLEYKSGTNQTYIYAASMPAGHTSQINYVDFVIPYGVGGDFAMNGSLSVGENPPSGYTFSLHGDSYISGRLNVNLLGDPNGVYESGSTVWWTSSDSLVLDDDYGDLSKYFNVGDTIHASDGSWYDIIESMTFRDNSDLAEAVGFSTLVTVVGTPTITEYSNVKLKRYPDLKIDMGTDEYVKTFRGESDPDITGWIMKNANGTACYIYPDAAGTGIVVSTTKP